MTLAKNANPNPCLDGFVFSLRALIHFVSQESLTSSDLFLLNKVKADKARVFLEFLLHKMYFQQLNKTCFKFYWDKSKTYYDMSIGMYQTAW